MPVPNHAPRSTDARFYVFKGLLRPHRHPVAIAGHRNRNATTAHSSWAFGSADWPKGGLPNQQPRPEPKTGPAPNPIPRTSIFPCTIGVYCELHFQFRTALAFDKYCLVTSTAFRNFALSLSCLCVSSVLLERSRLSNLLAISASASFIQYARSSFCVVAFAQRAACLICCAERGMSATSIN